MRVDRKRRQYVTTFLRALDDADDADERKFHFGQTDQELLDLFEGAEVIRTTLERDITTERNEALLDLYRKLRPGELTTVESARGLVSTLFYNPKRYDLTRVGRYKLNQKFGRGPLEAGEMETYRQDSLGLLTSADILETIRYLIRLHGREPGFRTDDIDHFGNRRVRTVGELIQNQIRVGLTRLERVVRERMTTQDPEAITPQSLINIRPVVASIKEFFGTSQLSQFMDQPNPLAELTHKRRLSALGPGGLSRERAGFEVRDVALLALRPHVPHRDAGRPEHRSDRLPGLLRAGEPVRLHRDPLPKRGQGDRVTGEVHYLTATEEERTSSPRPTPSWTSDGTFADSQILVRRSGGEVDYVTAAEIDYMDVSPKQVVSVATALIPFLEHDDANRALMGSNMQRQAVPLLRAEAPLVGTGVEERAAHDSGDAILAARPERWSRSPADARCGAVALAPPHLSPQEVRAVQPGHLHQPEGRWSGGQRVRQGDVLADGPSTEDGELALGRNLLVAFMPWEGYNYEDAILLSERLVKEDVLTSIHIEEYEIEARDTKLGPEEITRDIPNVGEEALRDLDEQGIVRIGAEVGPGDYPRGQGHPQGRDRTHSSRSACCGRSSGRRPVRCATCPSRCRTASRARSSTSRSSAARTATSCPPA